MSTAVRGIFCKRIRRSALSDEIEETLAPWREAIEEGGGAAGACVTARPAACRLGEEALQMEITVRPQVAAATIVEYSDHKEAANRYPYRIVSPSAPSRCCAVEMEQVGDEQREGDWIFVYMRCRWCGYTVRRFMYTLAPPLSLFSDVLEPAADRPWNQECLWRGGLRGLRQAEEEEEEM